MEQKENLEQEENKKKLEETIPTLKERIEQLKEDSEFVEPPIKKEIVKPQEPKKMEEN